jgi:hypothetical protein
VSDHLFKNGRANLLPYAVVHEDGVSVFIDRLYRPIIVVPGKWPRCDLSLAAVCDGPPMYGAKLAHTFYGEHAQPARDPIVRRRLRSLVNSCSVLKSELRRLSDTMDAAAEPPPEKARSQADLIRHTFSEGVAA